jgi:PEP-CTERM motif
MTRCTVAASLMLIGTSLAAATEIAIPFEVKWTHHWLITPGASQEDTNFTPFTSVATVIFDPTIVGRFPPGGTIDDFTFGGPARNDGAVGYAPPYAESGPEITTAAVFMLKYSPTWPDYYGPNTHYGSIGYVRLDNQSQKTSANVFNTIVNSDNTGTVSWWFGIVLSIDISNPSFPGAPSPDQLVTALTQAAMQGSSSEVSMFGLKWGGQQATDGDQFGGVVIQAVPEPSTLAVTLAALAVFFASGRIVKTRRTPFERRH